MGEETVLQKVLRFAQLADLKLRPFYFLWVCVAHELTAFACISILNTAFKKVIGDSNENF